MKTKAAILTIAAFATTALAIPTQPNDPPGTSWYLPPTLTGFENGIPPLDFPDLDDPIYDPTDPIFETLPPEVSPPLPPLFDPPAPPVPDGPPIEDPFPPLPPGYPGGPGIPEDGDLGDALATMGELFLEHTGRDLIDDIFEEQTGGDLDDFTDGIMDDYGDAIIGLGVVGAITLGVYGQDIVETIDEELLDPLDIELDPGDNVRIPIPEFDITVNGVDVGVTPVITITTPDDDDPDGETEFRLNFSLKF